MPKRKQSACADSGKGLDPSPQSVAVAASEGPRKVLSDFNSFEKLIDGLRSSKRIIAVTGAGISSFGYPPNLLRLGFTPGDEVWTAESVSCGIPDFRSENGVYDLASRLDLGLTCPEDLFDLDFFLDNPEPFFKFAKALYPGNYTPSPTHRFLKLLEDRGKLLRNFTQNVDGLEAQMGLKKFVACHGSFLTASCLSCKKRRKAEDIREEVMQQKVPRCPKCGGVMKPDITFFGEQLPTSVKRAVESDHQKADLLLVLGTSLKVAPVSRILQFMPPHVPQVLVNRELIRPPRSISNGFDLHLLGDCDDVIEHVCARLGWELPPVPGVTGPPTATSGGENDRSSEESAENAPRSQGDIAMLRSIPPPSFVPPNSYVFSSTSGTDESDEEDGSGSPACASRNGVAGESADGKKEESDFEEVITCDSCEKVVIGDVYECGRCFGFDLCVACYDSGDNDHTEQTGHSFRRTNREPVVNGGGQSGPA